MLIPISVEDVIASPGPLVAWPLAVVFFVRTALAVMGAWAIIDAVALLYGIQLRGNFRGLLSCENPSELWRAWRGTLTNWLIQHVYAPLGASQRHETLNLFAAFGVSLLWHALGVPFITPAFRLAHLLPVMLWAAINAVAVVLHVKLHRAGVLGRPAPGIRRGGRLARPAAAARPAGRPVPHAARGRRTPSAPARRSFGLDSSSGRPWPSCPSPLSLHNASAFPRSDPRVDRNAAVTSTPVGGP